MCLFYNNEGKEVCYHRDIYKSRPKNDINVQRSRVTILTKKKLVKAHIKCKANVQFFLKSYLLIFLKVTFCLVFD